MTTPTTGAISISNLMSVFPSLANNNKVSSYYSISSGVPASGALGLSQLRGLSLLVGGYILPTCSGGAYAYGLITQSNVYMWGYNGVPTLGTACNITNFGSLAGKKITSLAFSQQESYAIDSTGNVHGWGINMNNSLGLGTAGPGAPYYTPYCISTYTTNSISSVVIKSIFPAGNGYRAMCYALDSSNNVHYWGNKITNNVPQISSSGIPISASNMGLSNILKVVGTNNAQKYGIYAISLNDQSVYQWGETYYGTGGGSQVLINYSPTKMIANDSTTVVFKDLAAGWQGMLALSTTGQIYSAGNACPCAFTATISSNLFNISSSSYSNAGSLSNTTFTKIKGSVTNFMAIDVNSNLHFWGATTSVVPVIINTGALSGKLIVDMGMTFFAKFAKDSSNNIYAWGGNLNGALADMVASGSNVADPTLMYSSNSLA
jgi:alpha-tubulin suppressor-like RCC1 family protein